MYVCRRITTPPCPSDCDIDATKYTSLIMEAVRPGPRKRGDHSVTVYSRYVGMDVRMSTGDGRRNLHILTHSQSDLNKVIIYHSSFINFQPLFVYLIMHDRALQSPS